MLKREQYIEKIRPFYNETSLIKIIYGLRRSGKSVILKQIMQELIEKGVNEENIIYINFESFDFDFIKTAKDLDKYIKEQTKNKEIYYVLIDEVQKVDEFEKAINSLRVTDKYSIFITGSNSRMTFIELSTDLSGRYVSFRVNPLTFKETAEFTQNTNYEKLLFDIFKWGTLPQRFTFKDEMAKINYITDVYNSIILKDVIERMGIKDITGFNKILQYLLETEGREFSSNNVLEYLKINYKEISTETLYTYLEALCSTFIMNKIYRYDIKGKNVLKTLNKYYVSDLGIKHIKQNSRDLNYGINLENIVFNELLAKNYDIYIGKTEKGEIDFIAIKNGEKKYIQVCYELKEEKTIKREFKVFDKLEEDSFKCVISMDKEDYSREGIKHINIYDFLLGNIF